MVAAVWQKDATNGGVNSPALVPYVGVYLNTDKYALVDKLRTIIKSN